MKKIIFLSIFLLSSGFVFSGCANKQAINNSKTGINNQVDANGFRRPDFGQPEREPDVRGLVKSIVGNEVTILKIERPQAGEGLNSQNAEEIKTRAVSISGTTGHMPGMGGGPGGGSRLSGDAATREAALERMKEMSSGEEKVLIPVGIQMLKPETSEPGSAPVEANLEDIKIDKMIQIWFDENAGERKIANFVMVTR